MSKLQLFYPVYPWFLEQGFGENKVDFYQKLGMKGHNGLDFTRGTWGGHYYEINDSNVRAAHKGQVVYAGLDGSAGYGVVIRTIDPFDYNGDQVYFKTIYWHLVPNIPVKVGTIVNIGDVIGYADNTGMSTGNHLHFGLKPQKKGEADWQWWNYEQDNGYLGSIDPAPYMVGLSAYQYKYKWLYPKLLAKLGLS